MFLRNSLICIVSLLFFISCKNSAENEKSEVLRLPSKEKFASEINGKKAELFYLKNKNNFQAAVTNYGARMVGLLVPDVNGKLTDIVLGFDNVDGFVTSRESFYGAIVGRYGNRIAKGRFTLDGKTYQLDINNDPNSLHGGRMGFHNQIWEGKQTDSHFAEFTYLSKDGEEGYPGNLTTKVIYTLTDDNELRIDFEMSTDKKTVINITNHNYWNLNGEGSGTINNHQLMLKSSTFTSVDSTLIPDGITEVKGTPFDFTEFKKIGKDLKVDNLQLKYGKGYDHNFVLDKGLSSTPGLAAIVLGDLSGIRMEILTTEPAIQFYGGNFMEGLHTLKGGAKDDYRTAFCLETQHYPDSPNQPGFPSTILEPGKIYKSSTVHRFSIVAK